MTPSRRTPSGPVKMRTRFRSGRSAGGVVDWWQTWQMRSRVSMTVSFSSGLLENFTCPTLL